MYPNRVTRQGRGSEGRVVGAESPPGAPSLAGETGGQQQQRQLAGGHAPVNIRKVYLSSVVEEESREMSCAAIVGLGQ